MNICTGYGQRPENNRLASNVVHTTEYYTISGELNVARPGSQKIVSGLLPSPVPAVNRMARHI
jgi:hypothetical protein